MPTKTQAFVRANIEQESLRAELLSSYAQILFLLFLFTVYLVSPKGFSQTTFEPVPIAIAFYTPLVLLRCYLALRKELKNWQVHVFLFFDVAVLSLLIWSFHIQYDSPLTLSLRAPTFLYFFVFLSLRGLSYRLSTVVTFTLFFLFAWLVMTWLGLEDPTLVRSRSFRDYLTPSAFILGVEIDRIIAVCVTGVIVGVSIFRKRRLLTQLAQQLVKEQAMQRLIGKATLESFNIAETDLSPGRVHERTGATLLVDLRGFSRLTYNLPSAELLRLLGEYQQIVAQGVFDNGGVVDKFLGDGVLAHFGIAGDLSNISASALKAAEQIDADLQEWCQKKNQSGLGVAFGIALTQGTVTFGVIGHPDRMEITVLGESVNRAAKYEKYTKELGHRLIIDPELFARALSEGHAVSGEYQQFENVHVPGLPNSQHIVARIS